MDYKIIDINDYYRKEMFLNFSKGAKCSLSITSKIDVTLLAKYSKKTNSKFYLNFLYLLCKVLNSKQDFKLRYDYVNDKLLCYEQINPTQYVFHEDTQTFTVVYSKYYSDYTAFYKNAFADLEQGKTRRDYGVDQNHPNWFDASYIPWVSYDSLHLELPDGYLYLNPIINWGKYNLENGKLKMPVTVRMNHATADGYLLSYVFNNLEKEINNFCK